MNETPEFVVVVQHVTKFLAGVNDHAAAFAVQTYRRLRGVGEINRTAELFNHGKPIAFVQRFTVDIKRCDHVFPP